MHTIRRVHIRHISIMSLSSRPKAHARRTAKRSSDEMIQELSALLLDSRLRVRHIRRAIHPQVLIIRENEEEVGLARRDRRLIIQQYLLLHSEGVASHEES